jgi:RNA polymerase sigma factor (sigma-70 family)
MGMEDEINRDWESLQEYARAASQEAFARIVRQYAGLVYSTCFRDLRDHHLAEDATQAVFLVLARKARGIGRQTVLAGWLFRTARLVARNALKQEARRKARERRAGEMTQQRAQPQPAWEEMDPLLNEGLDRLGSKDRDAVLLHYLQGKTLAAVGASLGVSEDAARMRVSRALEKLRSFFGRKGPAFTVGAVAALLAANGAQAAPPGCAALTIATVARSAGGAAVSSGGAGALAKMALDAMLVAKIKIAAAAAAVALLVPSAAAVAYQAVADSLQNRPVLVAANDTPKQAIVLGPETKVLPAKTSPRQIASPAAKPSGPKVPSPAPARASGGKETVGPEKEVNVPVQPKTVPTPGPKETSPPPIGPKVRPAPPELVTADVPRLSLADLCRFRVDGGMLVVESRAPMTPEPAARVAVAGLPGKTLLARTPARLYIENAHAGPDGQQISTRITYRPGMSLEIQRTVSRRSGPKQIVKLRQDYRGEAATKTAAGQVALQISRDSGDSWNDWAAESFPGLVEAHRSDYQEHFCPLLREFGAADLCRM